MRTVTLGAWFITQLSVTTRHNCPRNNTSSLFPMLSSESFTGMSTYSDQILFVPMVALVDPGLSEGGGKEVFMTSFNRDRGCCMPPDPPPPPGLPLGGWTFPHRFLPSVIVYYLLT